MKGVTYLYNLVRSSLDKKQIVLMNMFSSPELTYLLIHRTNRTITEAELGSGFSVKPSVSVRNCTIY